MMRSFAKGFHSARLTALSGERCIRGKYPSSNKTGAGRLDASHGELIGEE